ncbi:MAG TPA: hypothetical protein VJ983_03255 [candidate division Zixibacteria bacterium]|nr:hypothetical protein [candidate division Zixibacteria bacterium]
MDYNKIIKRAFEIAWQYKSLWLFGLFSSGGVSYLNWKSSASDLGAAPESAWPFVHFNTAMLHGFLVAIILLVLVLAVITLLSDAALIDAVNRIERGGTYRFGYSFSTAVDMFLRFLGLALLGMFAMSAFLGILVLLGALAFWAHIAIGILYLIVAIPTALVGLFLFYWIVEITKRSLVVRRISIGDALEEAFRLFKKHFPSMVVLTLILIGFGIGISIVTGMIWFIANLPIGAVILSLGFGFVAALIAAVIMGMPISIVIGGLSGTFFSAMVTKYYFELVEPTPHLEAVPPAAPGPNA